MCWQAPGHFFQPPGLGEFSHLQSLKLRLVTLINNVADEPELLELLPALQQLTHLVLDSVLFQAPEPPVAALAHVPSNSDGWDPLAERLDYLHLTGSPPATPRAWHAGFGGSDDCLVGDQAVQNHQSWQEIDRESIEPMEEEQATPQVMPAAHTDCYAALLIHSKLECLEVINTHLP